MLHKINSKFNPLGEEGNDINPLNPDMGQFESFLFVLKKAAVDSAQFDKLEYKKSFHLK